MSMKLFAARALAPGASRTPSRAERFLPHFIVASGVLCFLLLAWGHLGLGAWLFPPAPTVAHQTALAGPYQVVLSLDSGQLMVGGANTVSVRVQDQRGQAVTGASLQMQPEMTTMPMTTPAVTAQAQAAGQYLARPRFSMAGEWRLTVTISAPGQAPVQTMFLVNVRWN
jgi:hypothetical protein